MIDKLIKRIWFICLCLACISLAGCFHVPDEDWLPNRNKTETPDINKDDEVIHAINSFMDWISIISSERDEMKNEENNTGNNVLEKDDEQSWEATELEILNE